MNSKKILPVLLLVAMAILALFIKRCQNTSSSEAPTKTTKTTKAAPQSANNSTGSSEKLDRNASKLFFTKHAKCRMACRHITQKEVREILAKGTVNYKKSELDDPKGPTYAVEGQTSDRQQVRIIFAPKQQHLTVVTVIDLDKEYKCNCK
jgi:ectoine hydroxylase-related dioxygenase (phytanoyl-CoA dioxygenase family)